MITAAAVIGGGVSGAVAARLLGPAEISKVVVEAPPPPETTTTTALVLPDVPSVIADVGRSVVAIDVSNASNRPGQPGREAAGTGFVLTADGLIATNGHVVRGATAIVVTLPDGLPVPGWVVGMDEAADLAVVRIDRSGLVPLPLGSSGRLRVGVSVIAVGHALGLEGGPTAAMGIVSALERSISMPDGTTFSGLVQTDAAINPGDSGGPLVDREGRVVGITTAGARSGVAENIGFAIAIDDALPILDRLRGRAG